MRSPIALSVALALSLPACGGSEPAPIAPKQDDSSQSNAAPKNDRPAIIYDLGDVAPDVARKNFAKLTPDWTACYEQAHAKNQALGGSVTFTLRTNGDGSVKWVYVKESDLGDRIVERCILDSVRATNWGEPVDAREGEIRGKTIGWQNDEDEAVVVDSSRVEAALGKAHSKIRACREKAGAKGKLRATFYVGAKGKPLSVGIAVDDASGEAAADCVHGVLMGLTYVNPSQQITKTTTELP